MLNHILDLPEAKELIQEKYKDGDRVLHIAIGRNYVHITRQLIKFHAQLCYHVNKGTLGSDSTIFISTLTFQGVFVNS